MSLSDPLKARPIGERAVATITASGMWLSWVLLALRDGGYPLVRCSPRPRGGKTEFCTVSQGQPYMPGTPLVPSFTACSPPSSSRHTRQPSCPPVNHVGGAFRPVVRVPVVRSYSHRAATE